MTQLSAHFTLEELTASATADRLKIKNNSLGLIALNNLHRLASALEEARTLLDCALLVSSGYRCAKLNAAVGGAKTSAHMDGRAADFRPASGDLYAAWAILAASPVAYDQLIVERTEKGAEWIHLGIAREGTKPRREALSAAGTNGAMTYTRVAEG